MTAVDGQARFRAARADHAAGRVAAAEAAYRRLLAEGHGGPDLLHMLGIARLQQGAVAEAMDLMTQALAAQPGNAALLSNFAAACRAAGQLADAIVHLRRAVGLQPANAGFHLNLGLALGEARAWTEAEASLRAAIACDPAAAAEAHTALGVLLRAAGRWGEATACYEAAVAADPAHVPAWRNLGNAHLDRGEAEAARACYERALALRPGDGGLRLRLATALPLIYDSEEHLAEERQRLAVGLAELDAGPPLAIADPVAEAGVTNFALAYQGEDDRPLQEALARIYARACPWLAYTAPHCRPGAGGRRGGRIRVGFCSAFLRQHTIGKLAEGLIAGLSRDEFEVAVLNLPGGTDDRAARIAASADAVIDLPADLRRARALIAGCELDILYYPDLGMEPLTWFLAFARLAPVQCVTWGHPNTTGIPALDWFVSSALFEDAAAQSHYSERLALLPAFTSAYALPPEAADARPDRAAHGLPADRMLYVCPQSLFKLHPGDDGLFAAILRADARAEIVLLAGTHAAWGERLRARFGRAMPDVAHRIRFMPRLGQAAFFQLLAACDVMIDPPRFGGGNTTLEAFAVGLPVVTLPGQFLRGRLTAGFYRQMGLSDLIAATPESYVALAVRLANDREFRSETVSRIRAAHATIFACRSAIAAHEDFFGSVVAV